MAFVVYILLSAGLKRTYVGQTQDIHSRLASHNSGKVRSTKSHIPWTLLHTESFSTRSQAIKMEAWYKSPSGRKKIAQLLKAADTRSLSDPALRDRDLVPDGIGTD